MLLAAMMESRGFFYHHAAKLEKKTPAPLFTVVPICVNTRAKQTARKMRGRMCMIAFQAVNRRMIVVVQRRTCTTSTTSGSIYCIGVAEISVTTS